MANTSSSSRSSAFSRMAARSGGAGAWRGRDSQLWLAATVYDAPPLDCAEALFQAKLEALLAREGYEYYHAHVPLLDRRGWPDLMAARVADLPRGRRAAMFWVEAKRATGKLSADQKRVCATLVATGQTVFCWRPADWAVVVEVVRSGDLSRGAATQLRLAAEIVAAVTPAPGARRNTTTPRQGATSRRGVVMGVGQTPISVS